MSGNRLKRAALALFTLGSFFVPAGAQLGHVVKAQKISDSSGGFTATLDEMDQFGRSIVNLGDLDGDGLSDLLVGAHTDDDGGLDQGSVYVLFLHANGFVKSWQKISDLEGGFGGNLGPGDQFGRAAANLGDLDGDGVVDIAVSANYDDDGGANKGAVYILFLNVDGTVKAVQKISELAGGLPVTLGIHDEFGRSLTNLGDLDGDGVTDLLVGTPEDDEGGTNTGALHVLFLNTDGTVKAYRRISKFTAGLALKPGDWFGFCSANLGDFDGDGVNDVAVGSVLDDDGGVNQGSLWLLMLNSDGSVKSSHEIDELEGGFGPLDEIDQFGTSVANIGDLDGDGVTDITVGAVKDDDGGTPGDPDSDVGALYVFFLRSDKTVKSWVKVSDESGDLPYSLDKWDWFGSATARLGGAAGDGVYNVAAGCRNDDDSGPNRGAIYLLQLNDGTFPVADFTADQTLGVAPLTVQFSDTSGGDTTSWVWSFSDGPQSTQRNPQKTFNATGSYDITLTARGPSGVDTLVRQGHIQVVVGPLAAFDASPRQGDCPLAVEFEDLSLGEVTSWSWDFGDGTSSNLPAPAHLYAECGSYDVTLTVTGPDGTHVRSEPGFVVAAVEAPVASFTRSPAAGVAPLEVTFSDLSSGAITSWSWEFGDGASSSLPSPSHTYTLPGTYDVRLNVSGPSGSDQEFFAGAITATLPPPTADFDAGPLAGVEPHSVAFTDLSSGTIDSWSWDFGDGQVSSLANPLHVYEDPGVYTVTLTTSGPGGFNVRTRTDLITVSAAPPGADFSATPLRGEAPLLVQFQDDSVLAVSAWRWDFGDGTGSNLQHPAHTYFLPGRYTISLTVTGPGGSDTNTRTDLIEVQPPATTADFSANPTSGAAPLEVAFADASSANASAWNWDFGDGTGSAERDPRHFYAVPGLYPVALTVTSATGSATRVRPDYIEVLEAAPVAAFALPTNTGVAPFTAHFDDLSSGAITTWIWDFGDGTSSRETEPSHVYTTPGSYQVTLTVSGPGGSDTEAVADLVRVQQAAPVAALSATPTDGAVPLAVQFRDLSSGAITAWSWSLGDGASSTLRNPQHTYTSPGSYTVALTVSGPGGSDTVVEVDLVSVREARPEARFTASATSGVAPLSVQFSDGSTGSITAWSWDFGDGASSTLASPEHTYTTPGTYSVALTVRGPGGTDVETRTGLISVQHTPPVADFSATPRDGYAPLAVTFADLSSGAIDTWSWDFGDGGSAAVPSPTHVFVEPGSYAVKLRVEGEGGSSVRQRVTVVRAAPIFADGSFEQQSLGLEPGAPWRIFRGNGTRVRTVTGEPAFPASGVKLCDLGAEGSANATPPSNPGGAGTPAFALSGMEQSFLFPLDAPHLFFEAAFLRNGPARSANTNDFMSVDIGDGKTIWNLYHADSFDEFPLVSAVHGLPMTRPERVHVDLAALYPDASASTVLTLRFGVGNHGNGAAPSRGLVDGFRFEPAASAVFRNGRGLNPALYSASPAVIGGQFTVTIDGSQRPAAVFARVIGRQNPLAGTPIFGGELLMTGKQLFSLTLPLRGVPATLTLPMPSDVSLIGLWAATQAVLFGGGVTLGNAFDLRLGY